MARHSASDCPQQDEVPIARERWKASVRQEGDVIVKEYMERLSFPGSSEDLLLGEEAALRRLEPWKAFPAYPPAVSPRD